MSRRNNDNDVRIFAMLKYGRNEKMTFCVFIDIEWQKLLLGVFIFIGRVGFYPKHVLRWRSRRLRLWAEILALQIHTIFYSKMQRCLIE